MPNSITHHLYTIVIARLRWNTRLIRRCADPHPTAPTTSASSAAADHPSRTLGVSPDEAAVDLQHMAIDVGAFVTGQEDRRVGQFVRAAQPPGRQFRSELLPDW